MTLRLATRQCSGEGVDARRPHVVLLDDALGVGPCAAAVDPGPAGAGGAGLVAEDAVLPQRGVEEQTVALAVLGDVGDAGLADLAGVPLGDVGVAEPEAGRRVAHAHAGLDQLGLTVALDAGDAEHLALVDVEGDVLEQRPASSTRVTPSSESDDVGDGGLGARRRQLEPTIISARSRVTFRLG
jgi:hypothetical protein